MQPSAQGRDLRSTLPLDNEWWCSRFVVGVYAVLLHSLACLYFVSLAKLHLYIQSTPAAVLVLSYAGSDLLGYFNYVIATSLVIATGHCLPICYYCWRAIPSRALRVRSVQPMTTPIITGSQRSRVEMARDKLEQWDHKLEKYCGVDFYELLVFVEIGLQIFQVYKLSHLIATRWINRLMVLVIVTNCWFIPVVSVLFRKKMPSLVKIVHLALDAGIEIVYGMVIPLVIFYPYYRDASHILYDTPYINFYMDTWFINACAENRQLYVTSWIDLCSKMAPGVSLFLRLLALQDQRAEHETRTKTASIAKITPPQDETVAVHRPHSKKRIVNGLLFTLGLGVLGLHLAASAVGLSGTNPGCLLEMIPFGSTQYSCAVMEVSCTQKHITGTKSELENALQNINPSSVQGLVLSHCEALSMPPRLRDFTNLIEIKIHNCSLAEWGVDAALTAQTHPILQNLYITMTNMSEIPEGLLSPDFPPSLNDIELCGTNLTGLPTDLFEKWPMAIIFYLELSPGVTEFPPALYHTSNSLFMLSLSSNSISTLPDDVFVGHQYDVLLLSGNPLTKLPSEVGTVSAATVLAVDFTDITEVPASWIIVADQNAPVALKSGFFVTAAATPVCDRLLGTRSQASGSLSGSGSNGDSGFEMVSWLLILCAEREQTQSFYYPLELEKQWRQRNRE